MQVRLAEVPVVLWAAVLYFIILDMYLRSVWAFYNQKVTAAVVVVALAIACVLASMAVYLKMRHINWVILHSEFARGDPSLEEGGPGVDEVEPEPPASIRSEPPTVVVDASGQQTLSTQSVGVASGVAGGVSQRTRNRGPGPSTLGAGTGIATATTLRSDSIRAGPSIRQMRSDRRRRLLVQQRKLFWLQQPIVMLRIIQASDALQRSAASMPLAGAASSTFTTLAVHAWFTHAGRSLWVLRSHCADCHLLRRDHVLLQGLRGRIRLRGRCSDHLRGAAGVLCADVR